jgi:hypothetical protein
VLTDQWLHTIKHKRWTTFRHSYKYENAPVRVNSRFMATLDFDGKDSIICIYDFKAAKDPLRDASSLLLATLRVRMNQPMKKERNNSSLYRLMTSGSDSSR